MGSVLRKTMVYLGLSEEEAQAHQNAAAASARGQHASTDNVAYDMYDDDGEYEYDDDSEADVMHLPTRNSAFDVAHENQLSLMSRIITVHPRTPHEAKTVGINFRQGIPVIMNLTQLDDADCRRLVDFAAGLAFGLHGTFERVTNKVFLLSPSHVAVNTPHEEGPDSQGALLNQP